VIAKKREIYAAQEKDSGKPANIIAKIIDGRVANICGSRCSASPFVKNPDETVAKTAAGKRASPRISDDIVGEGLQKKG
jgi:elongation factor Ts